MVREREVANLLERIAPLEAEVVRLREEVVRLKAESGRLQVENALDEGHRLAEPVEEAIKAQVEGAEVGHFDETGLRVAGRLHWMQ